MQIPLSAPDITEPEIAAVADTLRTPHLSLGPRLSDFEAAFTRLTNTTHAIAVSSGTAGLHLALLALDIHEGDEVIVPSFAFIAAANAIRYVGATPIFVDINPHTLNLSPAAVEQAITSRTRAILAVHTFGVPSDMPALAAIAQRHHLALIEDACEAIGATLAIDGKPQPIGSFGDIAVFAFYPNKQITTGEGGMIVTRQAALADRMRSLRNQGRAASNTGSGDWLQHAELGYNYRLSEISCTLGLGQLQRLPEILHRREQIAHLYHQHLANEPSLILPPLNLPDATLSWFVYVVRLTEAHTPGDRDHILHELQQAHIGCARYFTPIHLQPAYAGLRPFPPLPVTEAIAARTIALPFFNRINESQIATVCTTLKVSLRRNFK